MDYHYPGFAPYVDRAADEIGLKDPEMRLRARDGWHAARVTDALSQLVGQARQQEIGVFPKGTVKSVLDNIRLVREGLRAQILAIDAAVAEARTKLGDLATQEPDRGPEPAPAAPEDRGPAPMLRAVSPEQAHDGDSIAHDDAEGRALRAGKALTVDSPAPPELPGDEPQPSPAAVANPDRSPRAKGKG